MKTLKLLYPEWQGYGEDNCAVQGALAVHAAFAKGNDFVRIDIREEKRLGVEGGILGRSSIVRDAKRVLDRINLEQPDRILMIGGTCASEMVPVGYLNQRYRGDLAVLWLDAHPDLNTVEFAADDPELAATIPALLQKSGLSWTCT